MNLRLLRAAIGVGVGILLAGEVSAEEAETASPPHAGESLPGSELIAGPATTPAPVSPSGEDPAEIRRRIVAAEAALAGEPSLSELLRAALERADAERAETGRWKRGVRLSALLPALKVSGDYGAGRDEALDRYQDKPDRWGADTDRGVGIDVSLQWKLDRLVFNTDELRVYDSLADRAARRENLSAYLIGLYFERRRLQLEEMLLPQTDVGAAVTRRLRIEELGRTIDALTGGLLSSKMNKSREARP